MAYYFEWGKSKCFFFGFQVFNFSFFQIILDGDGATSRNRKWKTSSQVSFFLPGNEGAHMEARLYADPVNTSIQNGDKKKKSGESCQNS